MFERARLSSVMFYVYERVIRLMRLCCSVFSGKYFHESFFLFSVLRALSVFLFSVVVLGLCVPTRRLIFYLF